MRDKLKNILLILLVAMYFVASNGMFLEYISQWYSTGGEVRIALHAGPSKEFPAPTLRERTYVPQTSPVIVLSIALLAHTFVYPVERAIAFTWVDDALPCYPAVLSSPLCDRAPPAA